MLDDTIAAISTAPGRAGLAMLRVSGPETVRIGAALGLPPLAARHATVARLAHPDTGRVLDRVVATLYRAPASYTGEDLLEIGCHGGSLVPQLCLDAALAAGARLAEPGEFARRAFLNGKLDLLQVEATLDLVDARSEAFHRAALFQLEGGLSGRIEELRRGVLRLEALLAYDIDFPEEDEGPVPPERVDAAARGLVEEIEGLLRHAPEGELLRDGALTVIAGRPNSGKSSVFNALLGERRAIVTEVPGTTRDAIEAMLSVEGYPFRLVDTAGLREEPEYVEGIGIEVARGYLDRADVILFCSESGREPGPDEEAFLARWRDRDRPVLHLRTKADLLDDVASAAEGETRETGESGSGTGSGPRGDGEEAGTLLVSATAARGMDGVREALVAAVYSGIRGREETPLLTRRRQVRALREARAHLEAFARARSRDLPPEIVATHLRDAVHALETLLGVVDREEVLDVLFSSFCVGK